MFRGWTRRIGLAGILASLAQMLAIWPSEANHVAWDTYLQGGTCAEPAATPTSAWVTLSTACPLVFPALQPALLRSDSA